MAKPVISEAGVVLVLSGGGTKGFAHLGVIEVLEENNIPILGIVGTSMGSLMGALRASGYSAQDMRRIVRELDLPALFSENTGPMFVLTGNDQRAKTSTISALTYKKDQNGQKGPKGILTGDKLYMYFAQLMRHVTETDFSKLPIPYAAIATDIQSGRKVVLKNGNLASAMRASMSIPALFEPWVIDGRLLVDGGVTSNLPVYTAQELFPGVPIVAVDISDNLVTDASINSYMEVIGQALTILMRRTTNEEGLAADILLRPKVEGLGMLDVGNSDQIIDLGRKEALENLDEIKKISDRYPVVLASQEEEEEEKKEESNIVGDIEIHGLPEKLAYLVRKEYLSWIGRPFDSSKVEGAIETLINAQGIAMADYQLGRTQSGDILVRIDIREDPKINVGLSGYTTNLHPNRWIYVKGSFRKLLSEYDTLSGVLRLGEQLGIDLNYQTAPKPMDAWQINFSMQNWQIKHHDWDIYSAGVNRLFNIGSVNAGLGAAYMHLDGDHISARDDTDSAGPTFFIGKDTLDFPSDPTKGYSWRASFWWPDFDEVTYRLNYFKPIDVSGSFRTYFRLGFAEGDMNKRAHSVFLGGAEELYTLSDNPIEAERMAWTNLAFRRIFNRNAMGIIAGEIFASYGYAMDKEWKKIDSAWEIGAAVNLPNNFVDVKFAIMYGNDEFKTGFFLGVPIWEHYPLP